MPIPMTTPSARAATVRFMASLLRRNSRQSSGRPSARLRRRNEARRGATQKGNHMTANAAFWNGIAEKYAKSPGAKADIAFIVAKKPR